MSLQCNTRVKFMCIHHAASLCQRGQWWVHVFKGKYHHVFLWHCIAPLMERVGEVHNRPVQATHQLPIPLLPEIERERNRAGSAEKSRVVGQSLPLQLTTLLPSGLQLPLPHPFQTRELEQCRRQLACQQVRHIASGAKRLGASFIYRLGQTLWGSTLLKQRDGSSPSPTCYCVRNVENKIHARGHILNSCSFYLHAQQTTGEIFILSTQAEALQHPPRMQCRITSKQPNKEDRVTQGCQTQSPQAGCSHQKQSLGSPSMIIEPHLF